MLRTSLRSCRWRVKRDVCPFLSLVPLPPHPRFRPHSAPGTRCFVSFKVQPCKTARARRTGRFFLIFPSPTPPPFLLSFPLHFPSLPSLQPLKDLLSTYCVPGLPPAPSRCRGYRDQDECRLRFPEASTPGRQVTTQSSRPCRSKEGMCHPRGGDIGAVT